MKRSRLFALCVPGLILGALAQPAGAAYPDKSSHDLVLGQVNKTTRRFNGISPLGLNNPTAVAVDRAHSPNHLYVADLNNARVLGWRDVNAARQGGAPDLVIGQIDLYSSVRFRTDRGAVARPTGLAVDTDGTVFVADEHNGRVVGFKYPFDASRYHPTTTPPHIEYQADYLFGPTAPAVRSYFQPDVCNPTAVGVASTVGSVSTDTSLCYPGGLATDSKGNLYVADRYNSRVLVLLRSAATGLPNTTPSFAYGQTQLTGVTSNSMSNFCLGGASATTLCLPSAVFVQEDAGQATLYIADTDYNRVLSYKNPADFPPMGTTRAAERVFGQPDMVHSYTDFSKGPNRMQRPMGVAVDQNGVLWVAENSNHRAIGFAPPFAVDQGAKYLLGQPDFYSSGRNQMLPGLNDPTAAPVNGRTMADPRGLAVDPQGRVLVADHTNNRVLIFDDAAANSAASAALGQPDVYHASYNRTAVHNLFWPGSAAVDRPDAVARPGEPMHIYVADFGNSRVLGWWDLGSLQDGRPADLIIGQKNSTEYACNGHRPVDETTLCWPRAVAVDKSGDLWVADSFNHRVLRFPRPFVNWKRPAANLVLGQTGFRWNQINQTGIGTPPNARSLFKPAALALDEDAGIVWVADRDNDRVVGYVAPFKNGMPAKRLLIGGSATDFDRAGCTATGDAAQICMPTGLAVDENHKLWVVDRINHRVALYDPTSYVAAPSAPDARVISATPVAALGMSSATTLLGSGVTTTKLSFPEGVALLLNTDALGVKTTAAVLVADSGNHRVLVYNRAIGAGQFAPLPDQVLGQTSYTSKLTNKAPTYPESEIPSYVETGLQLPSALLALPEGLFISEGGCPTANSDYHKDLAPELGVRDPGNNRVGIMKTALYPGPGAPPPAMDGGIPEDPADLAQPDNPDLATPAPADLAAAKVDLAVDVTPPRATGCSAATGSPAAGSASGLGALGLLGLWAWAAWRQRHRRAA